MPPTIVNGAGAYGCSPSWNQTCILCMFSLVGCFWFQQYPLILGKNYGFAKFGSEESADNAQRYMHGETISGNHLKCLDAEDPPPESKKSKT